MTERRTRSTQTASHWGVYRVVTDRDTGEVVSTDGVPFDRDPSPIQAALPEVVRDRMRIDQPYVREGYLRSGAAGRRRRGGEGLVPVSWDQALDLVCTALLEARERGGNESIDGGSYGWASAGRLHHSPSVLKRFLGLFGGYTDKSGNHSFGAALGVMPYILGRTDITRLVVPWPELVAGTRLLVMFGGAPLKNAQIDPGGAVNHDNADWFRKAREAGVEVVCVSPYRHDVTGDVAPEWLPIRPNTDVALMLGLMYTLVARRLVDGGFVQSHCAGYEEFERYLTGESDGIPKDADWAARLRLRRLPAAPGVAGAGGMAGRPADGPLSLHLLTNQPTHRLHSQLDNSTLSRTAKVAGREAIRLNAEDAARRGLRPGDVVRMFNDRGAFLTGVTIAGSDTLLPGVAQVPTGAWYDPEVPGTAGTLEKHGNPNVATLDKGTSRLTQCTAAQTCLVEVERCENPPPVTAFDWPPVTEIS